MPFEDQQLSGRVAVVTGGSRGIGRAIVALLAARGARVAVGYRTREAEASEAAAAIRAEGGTAWAGRCDVADESSVAAFFEAVARELGPVDILVNNAGVTGDAHIMLLDTARWAEVVGTNLHGAYFCTRAVVRGMLGRRWGRIINISSPSAHFPLAGQAATVIRLSQLYADYRIPECVGGYPRTERPTPGAYPQANTPQLWNATAFPLMVQCLLGVMPLAPYELLLIDPALPAWLPEIVVRGLRVGQATVPSTSPRKNSVCPSGQARQSTLTKRHVRCAGKVAPRSCRAVSTFSIAIWKSRLPSSRSAQFAV